MTTRFQTHPAAVRPPVAPAPNDVAPARLSLRRLSLIYLLVPVALVAVAVDLLVFDGLWRDRLPRSPQGYLLLALVFGTPHIVASNIILFSTPEYLRRYRRRLLVISAAIGAFFLTVGLLAPRDLVFALIAAWTVIHVAKQQVGIGNITARLSGWTFQAWLWLGIGSGILYYNAIYLPRVIDGGWRRATEVVVGVVSVAVVILTVRLLRGVSHPVGRRWVVANGAVMALGGALWLLGYPFVAILLPRFAHDTTAFAFYLNHDVNRARAGMSSWFHRPFDRFPFGTVLLLPVVAVGLSAVLERAADGWVNAGLDRWFDTTVANPVSLGVVGFLGLLHYAFESFTWGGASPYRPYVGLDLD
ncbi:MAG: hypothetical protein ACK5PP_14655 [Acidimicrobiales bacterium]